MHNRSLEGKRRSAAGAMLVLEGHRPPPPPASAARRLSLAPSLCRQNRVQGYRDTRGLQSCRNGTLCCLRRHRAAPRSDGSAR